MAKLVRRLTSNEEILSSNLSGGNFFLDLYNENTLETLQALFKIINMIALLLLYYSCTPFHIPWQCEIVKYFRTTPSTNQRQCRNSNVVCTT